MLRISNNCGLESLESLMLAFPRQTIELVCTLGQRHAMPAKQNHFLRCREGLIYEKPATSCTSSNAMGECIQPVLMYRRDSNDSSGESTRTTFVARRLRWINGDVNHYRTELRQHVWHRHATEIVDTHCSLAGPVLHLLPLPPFQVMLEQCA
jgi:hypothetical protein